ncbi:CPBP family intramembrane glutamic endopeptidase [Haloplanus halobius]|uniref:CPBP family intramembrane glutamic endopeptidase n=1 Tax=Haloplanus halobius TaxID=2934938 RepID=UPI00200C6C97|nr:CPBP family intramembrane glutamic endopeptidase [Haloplanus sp. XH21]
MDPRTLVWNDRERRPRAPLRVVLLTVVTVLLALGTSLGASVEVGGLRARLAAVFGDVVATTVSAVAGIVLVAGVVTLAVLIAGRYIDRRHLRDFGFHLDRGWWLDCGFGLLLGALLMTLVFAVEVAAGWTRVTGIAAMDADFLVRFLGLVVAFVAVGGYEELLARGYLLTNAAEGLVGWVGDGAAVGGGVAISSVVFGLAHASNPNATLLSTGAIVLAGGMLAVGYVLTGDLAIPIGLHTTWNLFQGGVYGFPVSGLGIETSVVAIQRDGPRLLTGGTFGPEAGLIGVGAMGLGSAAIAAWVRWRTGDRGIAPGVTTPDLREGREDIDGTRWEPTPDERD